MDYRLLLKKYMNYVLFLEGTDFTDFNVEANMNLYNTDDSIGLTEEDMKELITIAKEL